MASQLQLFNQFVENLNIKGHDFSTANSAQLYLGFCASAPTADMIYTDLTFSNTSPLLLGVNIVRVGGLVTIKADNYSFTAVGDQTPFRYIVLFDDWAHLIGWLDCGSDITLLDGDIFVLDLSSGILTVSL